MTPQCFNCDAPTRERFGEGWLCEDCRPGVGEETGENTPPEGGFPTKTPGSDPPKPGSSSTEDTDTGRTTDTAAEARAALDDAVDWFHSQLDKPINDHAEDGAHPDRPTTAREWFEDVRGFDPQTVDQKRLGWAPADATDQLVAYLHDQGHTREAILATGLFTEDLRLLWHGRYVFPYYGRDGTVAYAIARCTGGEGGGDAGYDGHPRDFLAGKYTKLAHTKECVAVEEPIYGLRSLDRDGPVIITEGVADAVRAHEAGYACLSPVTTQFKHEHRKALLDELGGVDRRVYVVQDAERPTAEFTDEGDGWDCIGLEQLPPGLKGGITTAAFLADGDVDAHVAELPRPGIDKIDLDDYLGCWSDTLRPVLASAKPPDQFDAYDEVRCRDHSAGGEAEGRGKADQTDTGAGHREYDDLAREDVFEALGHVSSTLHYDDWIQLGYAVHDWDDGETGKKVFEQWSRKSPKWAPESQDAIDWIWSKATPGREMSEGRGPTTVATLVYRAINGGWSPPRPTEGGEQRTEPVSALPLAQLDALNPDERRRAAKRRGYEWPTTDQARDRLRDTIFQAIRHEDDRVVDAPTSLGKSYTVATTRWGARDDITGGQPVVHLCETRDARDEVIEAAEDDGGSYFVLEARHEACPVAAGDHDPADDEDDDDPEVVITMNGQPASKWIETVCDGRGVPFSAAHRYLEEHHDQGHETFPCRDTGRFDGDCDAAAQWDELRDDAERVRCEDVGTHGHSVEDCPDCYETGGGWNHPLIIATHNFAYVPGLRHETNVVIDEQPDFTDDDLDSDRVRKAVGAYLREIDAPVSTWEAFIQLARHEGTDTDAAAERDALRGALDDEPDRGWYFENADAHMLAPALARAIFFAEPRASGRRVGKERFEPPRLDAEARDDDAWNSQWVTVVLDELNDVRIVRSTPDLSAARAVVGLDAHPALPDWQLNTLPWIDTTSVLDADERQLWRRYERGKRVVQVGEWTRPLASGKYFDDRGARVLVEHLRETYGGDFRTAITADAVEDRLERIMGDAGVQDPGLMHYGEEKSRNDFDGEQIGYIEGCIDPGDDHVLDLLAELDCDAEPVRADPEECTDAESANCDDCDGDGCHKCLGTGLKRAHGREFTGDDAGTAKAILASVREAHTAQAAGRYARSPDDPEDTATVFVRTDAMPPGFADVQVPGAEWVFADGQSAVVEALRERDGPATARELADDADVSKEHVRTTLAKLADEGVVDAFEGAGAAGATLYADAGVPNTGMAEVNRTDDDTANDRVLYHYTWSLAIGAPDEGDMGVRHATTDTAGAMEDQVTLSTATNGGDRRHDDTD